MKKVLVTGGTVFVSRFIAEYYVAKGYDVYVLNRNSREQSKGVKLIFVFDCALRGRCFYLPENGEMKLQFFYVEDLCRFIDILLMKKPQNHIFNVGNLTAVSIRQWVEMCYSVAGKKAKINNVYGDIDQRKYFSFYNYEYYLDVSKQHELMPDEKDLYKGLEESFMWYRGNSDKVNKKPFFEFIDSTLIPATP